MPQDIVITPAIGNVDFRAGTNVTVAQLSLSAANVLSILGNLSIGDATANVYIGDGQATVDIVFEQSGSIKGLSGKTITLGQSNSNVAVNPTLIVNTSNVATAIQNGGGNGVGNIGNSTGYFNTVFAKATSAQYADLAEIYISDADYPAGTVVVFGGQKEITESTSYAQMSVAGVISTNPAHIMNAGSAGLPVALQGRVPCRVIGTIHKGDLVTSSDIAGVASKLDPRDWVPGSVIGKALEDYDSAAEGTIEVVVGRV